MTTNDQVHHSDVVLNMPFPPDDEVPRDVLLNQLVSRLGDTTTILVVHGSKMLGKSNVLAQFIRQYRDHCISYFVTTDPYSQTRHAFLYSVCTQMCILLEKNTPAEDISVESLLNLLHSLCLSLIRRAKMHKERYYFVIDGVERTLQGPESDRIIDLLPLQVDPKCLFMLISCRTDQVARMPLAKRQDVMQVEVPAFGQLETRALLSDLGISAQDVSAIFEKSQGIPGYLRKYKEMSIANGLTGTDISNLPPDLDRLINEQLNDVMSAASESVKEALDFLAASPAPLPATLLASLTGTDGDTLKSDLLTTGVVKHDPRLNVFHFDTEVTRDICRRMRGTRAHSALTTIIALVSSASSVDELLLTTLLSEAQDYKGILALTTTKALVGTLETSRDVSRVLSRLQLASSMAAERGEIDDLFSISYIRAAMRSFLSTGTEAREIRALIAVGKSQMAVSKAYSTPDFVSKVRLLASAYSAMKERDERVPREALDELRVMIANVKDQDLDADIARDIAVELFAILPDAAIDLLSKFMDDRDDRSIIESAIAEAVLTSSAKPGDLIAHVHDPQLSDALRMHSGWLVDLAFEKLIDELKRVNNTKSKEFIVRQWCWQNSETPSLARAIALWLDTVVSDKQHVIPLRSLRQISERLLSVQPIDRIDLIVRIDALKSVAISSPREEWTRLELSIAEALQPLDDENAELRFRNTLEDVRAHPVDLDIMTECLAWIWVVARRTFPGLGDVASSVLETFEQCFSSLLANSASHLELIEGTIRAISTVDPRYAFGLARQLNLRERRESAVQLVLKTALTQNGQINFPDLIAEGLHYLNANEREHALLDLVTAIQEQSVKVTSDNLHALRNSCDLLRDPTRQALATALIAVKSKSRSNFEAAIDCWRKEDDLKVRLAVGYDLIELAAGLDIGVAEALSSEVEQLLYQPGSALAGSRFGSFYYEALLLTIYALTLQDFSSNTHITREVVAGIERIPAARMRVELFAHLAASSYRLGYSAFADEVVRAKVVPALKGLNIVPDRHVATVEVLAVVAEYDLTVAQDIATELPEPMRDEAWQGVINWTLSKAWLGEPINVEHLRVPNDYRRIHRLAIPAAREIAADTTLFGAILAIANVVEASYDSLLDLTQAVDTLQALKVIAESNIPDKRGIQHDGFKILAYSTLHRVACRVYEKIKFKRGPTRQHLTREWHEIATAAKNIPNLADRVFVVSQIAEDVAFFNDGLARGLLDSATEALDQIPAFSDRVHRLQVIVEAWVLVGDKTKAQEVIGMAANFVEQLKGSSADQLLQALVQAAYRTSPTLADELLSRFDSRSAGGVFSPAKVSLEVQKIVEQPTRIRQPQTADATHNYVLQSAASRMRADLVVGRVSGVATTAALSEWINASSSLSFSTYLAVARWTIASLHAKQAGAITDISAASLLEVTSFLYEFAKWISPAGRDGVPDALQDAFPGLSSQIEVFRPGEELRAKEWLQKWLAANVRDYLKICDPYFGLEQLDYLQYVPIECKILVVTTDKRFAVDADPDATRRRIEMEWRRISARPLPKAQFVIVPHKQEDQFHDRLIVTATSGLDLGQSLNGLGHKYGKVTVLTETDAKELERTYVDALINQGVWFMNRGLTPHIVILS